MPRDKREKEVLDMVSTRIGLAYDGNVDYLLRAVDNEQLYHNYIDETTNPYLSNIAIPWPYIVTESYLGKCIQVMAATLPYVHVVEEDDDSRPKARKVERDANMVFYRHKWPVFSYKTYKQAFKYGTAFVWEKPWGIVDGQEMPIFEIMNFFKVSVNPTVLTLDDPDAYLIYETYLPMDYILQFANNPKYKNMSRIRTHTGEIFTEEEKSIRAFKEQADLALDDYSKLVQVWFYWDHGNFIMITNFDEDGGNVIRDDRENFIGRIPIDVITPIPLDNEFYGMSILEESKDLFAECNENRNQFNDAAWLMLNPQYLVARDAQIKKKSIESRPGGLIFTEDVNMVKPLPQDWNLLAMTLKRQESIYQDIMNTTNAFPQMRGQQLQGTETATEYMGMRSAGELRSDTYNLLLATLGIEEMVKHIVEYKKMFMVKPSNFYYWPEGKTETTTAEDYEGNFTYKAFASFKHLQEIERKQLIEAMAMVFGGVNGAFLPYVMPKAEEWLDRLLDSFPNIRSPEQLRLSEEERMMAQAQTAMQQMMLPLMGQGGNEQPAMGEKAMRTPEQTPNLPMAPMMGGIMSQ